MSTIPVHMLEAVARHHAEGRRAALVVRHAERHHVTDLRTHEEVRLTERGHEQARAAGGHLAKLSTHIRVHHSPVERCGETARGIVAGAVAAGAQAEVVRAVDDLYAPFIKDRHKAFEMITSVGGRFLRQWFDGKLPADVFEPRASAALGQVQLMAALAMEHETALPVLVSHDWNIALVREDLLGITPETTWPGFLDGVVVAIDGDDVVVELDGRVGRRTRGKRA